MSSENIRLIQNKFYNYPLKLFDEHHNSINPEEISWIMQKLSDNYIYNVYLLKIFLICSMCGLGITAMN